MLLACMRDVPDGEAAAQVWEMDLGHEGGMLRDVPALLYMCLYTFLFV